MYNETTKKNEPRQHGLGQVLKPCEECPKRDRKKLGCQRFGNNFVVTGPKPIRIAKEDKPTARGGIRFCPRSFDQPILEEAVFDCINVIERNGGLSAAFHRSVYQLWARQVGFYTEVVIARDNYLSERGS